MFDIFDMFFFFSVSWSVVASSTCTSSISLRSSWPWDGANMGPITALGIPRHSEQRPQLDWNHGSSNRRIYWDRHRDCFLASATSGVAASWRAGWSSVAALSSLHQFSKDSKYHKYPCSILALSRFLSKLSTFQWNDSFEHLEFRLRSFGLLEMVR